jgi:NADH-quinone oxidoreductase subunit L
MNENLPWIILFLPLAAAFLIGPFGKSNPRTSVAISVGAIVLSFLCAVLLWIELNGTLAGGDPRLLGAHYLALEKSVRWLEVGNLRVEFGVAIDPLSMVMLLVVTGVGSLIHIYSVAYMQAERSYTRFFACLSFFTFSMLGIVLSNNFLQMFIFWELVGVSSYMLVGFWYEKPAAADAAKKAFLTNRLGDFGFLAGIIMIWAAAGSLNFGRLHYDFIINPTMIGTLGGVLILCGAAGKSAQFPLHVWLPDAMEGPTPVSALIHAATMVAAGVYMLCRVFYVFNPTALEVIAWMGGFTALLAALIAVQQDDIKRILAYSTLSQLGYMVMAVGLAAPSAAMFHLATHACFKALLFLAAGSVIYALHHEQNIWKMGRLKDKLPVTAWTFLIGTLALCGVPPLSGFYSKDAIIGAAWEESPLLFGIAVVVAFLTTFYMFRLVFVVFWGKAKSDLPSHAHESPRLMTYPLVVLAIASLVAGGLGIYQYLDHQLDLGRQHVAVWPWWLSPSLREVKAAVHQVGHELLEPFRESPVAAGCGLAAIICGFLAARGLYVNAASDPLPKVLPSVTRWMRRKFYFDEIYTVLIATTHDALAAFIGAFDQYILSGGIRLIAGGTELMGRGLRLFQSGNLQIYSLLSAAGIALAIYFLLRT